MNLIIPPSNFTTGMDVEEQSFTWTIENFSIVQKHRSIINTQKIYFSAGGRVGHPSKWSVYLKEAIVDGQRWISIYFNIVEPSGSDSTWKNSFAAMTFVMEGAISINNYTGPREVATMKGYGYSQFIPADSTLERLVIKLTFKLYVPSKSIEVCQSTVKEFQVKFANQARKDFAFLLKNPVHGSDIKIISKDKKEFSVPKGILAVRSPVLDAMIRTDMIEANSGVIELPDISSGGLEVLLTFLYTGALHPNWRETKVVVELTNAAAKYQLKDLLKFLDKTLGRVCKVDNALALFTLSHNLSLKKAEVELLKFIHEKSSSSPDVFCKMLEGVSLPGGNVDVESVSKEKSRLRSFFLRVFRIKR